MGALSPAHLLIILVVALMVIGPGKLPETGAAIGRAVREFRQAVDRKDAAATTALAEPPRPSGPTEDGPPNLHA